MDVEIAYPRKKLQIAIQVCLGFAPIVFFDPILGECCRIVPVGSEPPVASINPVGPLRIAHAIDDTIDGYLWDIGTKWAGRFLGFQVLWCKERRAYGSK
jgi:hypothetical protein